jgi:hypothetical protein
MAGTSRFVSNQFYGQELPVSLGFQADDIVVSRPIKKNLLPSPRPPTPNARESDRNPAESVQRQSTATFATVR